MPGPRQLNNAMLSNAHQVKTSLLCKLLFDINFKHIKRF